MGVLVARDAQDKCPGPVITDRPNINRIDK